MSGSLPVGDVSPLVEDGKAENNSADVDAVAKVGREIRDACLKDGFLVITGETSVVE